MKTILSLLLFCALTASAQMPFITGMMAQSPPAAGGGESSSPALQSELGGTTFTTAPANPLNISITVPSHSDGLLVVAANVMKYGQSANPISTLNYDTSAGFTEVGVTNFVNTDGHLQIWYLKNPAVKTANVSFGWDITIPDEGAISILLFTNVNQTTSVAGAVANYVSSKRTSTTLSPTASAGDLVFDALGTSGLALTFTPNGGEVANRDSGDDVSSLRCSTNGSAPISWTVSSTGDYLSQMAIAIKKK